MAVAKSRRQPTPGDYALRAVGAAIVIVGILIAIGGVMATIDAFSDHTTPDPLVQGVVTPHEQREIAGLQLVLLGLFVLTSGRYVFRAAGKRGSKDRTGRALIILGYGLVITGMAFAVRYGMFAESMSSFWLSFAGFGIPGAAIAKWGMSLSDEEPLFFAHGSTSQG